MKIHLPVAPLYLLILGVLTFSTLAAQPVSPIQKQAVQLLKSLERNHYQPPLINDRFSSQVFYQFMGTVDPDQVYFNTNDWKELSGYRYQIDDELKGSPWKFLPQFTALYQQRLTKADKNISDLIQKPFNLTTNETLALPENDSTVVAADEAGYNQRWSRYLKYHTLHQLVQGEEAGMDEAKARPLAGTIAQRNIKRVLEHPDGFENYVGSLFLQAMTAVFDPHSSYLSKTARENFQSAMSSEGLSFGIDLDEKPDGSVVIERLVPGGPAWKSNELHQGDVLIALKWAGKPAISLAGSDLSEVMHILQATNTGRLEITVKGVNGQVKKVTLTKEKLREDENIVKSFILKGDKKVGYVSLPGFYTQWEEGAGTGCANDLAKEIVKLKEEGIQGLILDIRNNGGGSLTEGISLAGIFIDQGPMAVLQGKDRKPVTLKDQNRGTIYDGPLVLMVNGQSASASELLASTLQDYNRALIVGSSTFGKATGQIIMPIDSSKRVPGFVSTTIFKLYRVTGKSAQLTGVHPDIHLPDFYETMPYREALMPFALAGDSISKKVFYTPLKALPVAELVAGSAARVSASPSFQLVKQFNEYQLTRQKRKQAAIPLTLTHFKTRAAERDQWMQSLEKASSPQPNLFSIENHRYSQALMRVDAYGKELNDHLIENMQEDFQLAEAYQITRDLIQITKPN